MNEKFIIDLSIKAWDQRIAQATKILESVNDWTTEVAPGRNKVIYLAGHLLVIHDRMIEALQLGQRSFANLDDLFLNNPQQSDNIYPDKNWLKKEWDNLNQLLAEKFNEMTVADWLSKHIYVSEEDFKLQPERNKLNLLINRTGHLSTHIGQLLLIKNNAE
jgi:hypothetical protein